MTMKTSYRIVADIRKAARDEQIAKREASRFDLTPAERLAAIELHRRIIAELTAVYERLAADYPGTPSAYKDVYYAIEEHTRALAKLEIGRVEEKYSQGRNR